MHAKFWPDFLASWPDGLRQALARKLTSASMREEWRLWAAKITKLALCYGPFYLVRLSGLVPQARLVIEKLGLFYALFPQTNPLSMTYSSKGQPNPLLMCLSSSRDFLMLVNELGGRRIKCRYNIQNQRYYQIFGRRLMAAAAASQI